MIEMGFLFGSVLSSAFLLFLVQPLVAKQILPLFGGTAAVWAVCLVFYQAVLLGGYTYSHLLIRLLGPRAQSLTHAAMSGLSLLALPIGVPEQTTAPENPDFAIVWLLLRAVGLPYFVLSATSPLMQAWYARLRPEGQAYKLFGWSNLSCAAALLSFPFLLEPKLELSALNVWWSRGYWVVAALLLGAAWTVFRHASAPQQAEKALPAGDKPTWRDQAVWLFFSALGSIILVSVTSHLCQVIAPVPFLWTVPLLLYLLTFAACFEREWYTRKWGMPLAGVSMVAMSWGSIFLPTGQMLLIGIPVFAAGVFFTCFFCHGELAARKPAPAHLTHFYFVMAAGGALGSFLVAFGAPRVFSSYAEMPLALAICSVALLFLIYGRNAYTDIAAAICATLVTAPAYVYMMSRDGQVAAGRNFYGSLRVQDSRPVPGVTLRKIFHGGISHGAQWMNEGRTREPITYYGANSAPGIWFRNTPAPRRVGVVGLGAGALAAYARPGDYIRFYEINPMVVDFARHHFRFLDESPAKTEVAVGDGRLLLAAERPQQYDLLVVDAFSGDSIPVHLLTREAFALYKRHLKPGGLLAFHLSNLYLELQPVVSATVSSLGMVSHPVINRPDLARFVHPSSWTLVGTPEALARLPLPPPRTYSAHVAPWTDGYSTLLAALD